MRGWIWLVVGIAATAALVGWSLARGGERTAGLPVSPSAVSPPTASGGPASTAPAVSTAISIFAPTPTPTPKASPAPPSSTASPTTRLSTTSLSTSPAVDGPLPPPTPVPLAVSPALAGEGKWDPVGPTVGGVPGMYETQFRADAAYPGQLSSAVWIDPLLMRVALVPGLSEPGGRWSEPPDVPPAQFPLIAAAFNGGFLFKDARGGFYLDGETAVPLREGAASLVIDANGRADIGAWGSEVTMTSDVVAVLQNLVPLVDHGEVASSATYYDGYLWGAPLNGKAVVARSGIGVTATGALVYVAGPALSARTLGESLQRAGALRAMTLDMNPEWVTFNIFNHPNPADPSDLLASKLYAQMVRPATRYLGPGEEERDFLTVSLP